MSVQHRWTPTHTDLSRAFEPTWSEWSNRQVDLAQINTDVYRIGWPKPTIYREHEVIHILCNIVDKALAALTKEESDG